MKKEETLSPTGWISYWHAKAQREIKKTMKFIKPNAGWEARLSELLTTLTPEQQLVIGTAIEMTDATSRLSLLSELHDAFQKALNHADTGVQPGEKPRIVK